ncbi:ABC transporter permease [Myxococcota bacterium]|nr:ABC transporter permease [Myxococcota bacterium]
MDQLALLVSQTILISIPLVLAALGGTSSERSGVVNIALEGILLAGAFVAAVVGWRSGNVVLGVVAGVLAGVGVSVVHAFLSVHVRADQIISGLALNLFVAGATEYASRLVWPASASRTLPSLAAWTPTGFDVVDTIIGRPFVLATIAITLGMAFLLERTVFGLRQRAVGESPAAADTLGVSVTKLRYASVALSGALAGLGGAWLAFNVGQFQHNMSAGKGYIAMAAVVFGKWSPIGATLACLLFGFSEALAAACERWQVPVPSELIGTLPYVLTIVALVGVVGRARAPRALGTPYEKSAT